jgi:hypothetical protein
MSTPLASEPTSNTRVWIGRILSTLAVLFLLFDAISKLMRVPQVVQATAELGYPASTIVPIGTLLLVCTLLYAIPRTSLLGAVLLTGYLGGAIATKVRVGMAIPFELGFGIVIWGGLLLRDARLRRFIRAW